MNTSFSIGKALRLWALFVAVFVLFGGLGAGLTAVIFQEILRQEFSDTLYAIVFGVTGFMAYRLCQRVLAAARRPDAPADDAAVPPPREEAAFI